MVLEGVIAKVYSFIELQHAKQIMKDFPKICEILDDAATKLCAFTDYRDVRALIDALVDAGYLLRVQEEYYRKKFDNREEDV